MKKYKILALGGTFDRFHKGHEALLKKALEIGEKLLIGISSDEFAFKERGYKVEPFYKRIKAVESFIQSINPEISYKLIQLEDPYGPTLFEGNIDALLVSQETKHRALIINEMRKKRGLKPLEIIVIDMVLAENGLPISSERVRKGKITRNGKVLRKE